MRSYFFAELLKGLKIVWPILSGLIGIMVVTGFVVCELEDWPAGDGIYFAFISGLTIGYGDLHPITDFGKLFTVVYIVVGLGLILGFINAVYDHYKDQRSNGPGPR